MGLAVGTLADRPAPQPGLTNRLYWATDIRELFRDTGSSWDTLLEHTHDVMEEDMTQVADQNRIHTAAYYRQVVLSKFGANLQAFWPCNDANAYVRDLMRRHPLTGGKSVVSRQTGLIDFSQDVQSHYLTEQVVDRGALSVDTGNRTPETAIPLPAGRWTGFQFRSGQSTNQTVYVGKADIDPADLAANALYSVTSVAGSIVSGEYNHTVTFPRLLTENGGGYWVYMPTTTVFAAAAQDLPGKVWNSGTNAWDADLNLVTLLDGAPRAYSWSSLDEFSMGIVVDGDDSPPDGRILCIQDNTNDWAHINMDSDGDLSARVRNSTPTDYTIGTGAQLHGGTNMIILTFKKNLLVGLYLNGELIGSDSPADVVLTATTLNISLGAKVEPGQTVTNLLPGVRVSDAFIAHQYLDAEDVHELYAAAIQGLPMTVLGV